jgi:Helix-hairpin-helix motif
MKGTKGRRDTLRFGALGVISAGAVLLLAAAGALTSTAVAAGDVWPVPSVPAQQPGLTMDCGAGQVDLNHATLAQLQTLPEISAPIAERIVSMRPHDRVRDLLVVPGIGPDKLADVIASGRACATPLTLPPPAADVCRSATQLDVNDAKSQAGVAKLFGGPTAQRLVNAEPYPDLNHALVVLAAGAGPGKVAKYRARLCATPVPKTTGGVNYSWVYSAAGGRADLGPLSLIVPPGTLSDPVGQWLRIAPQPTPTPDLPGPAWPSADFSVLGAPWADGTKHVYVTLPTDPELAEFTGSADPVVGHWSDPSRSGGVVAQTQTNGDGTITAAVTHLSFLDSLSQGVSWVFQPLASLFADARFRAPSCDGSFTLDPASGRWYRDTAHVDLLGALLDLPGNNVPPFGWPIKHCVESASPGSYDATVHLVNNTRTFASFTQYNGDALIGGDNGIGADPLQLIVTFAAQGLLHHPVAYPGGDVTATVASGDRGAVKLVPSPALTAVWFVLEQSPVKDILDEAGRVTPVTSVFQQNLGCLLSELSTVVDLSSDTVPNAHALEDGLIGAVKDCLDYASIRSAIVRAEQDGLISPDKVGALGVALNKLQRYVLWLPLGQFAITGYDTWLGNAGGGAAGIIDIENYAPKPTLDAKGRQVQENCLHQHGLTWQIDEGCQDAYYARIGTPPTGSGGQNGFPAGIMARDVLGHVWLINDESHVVHPVADGGTYLCLAKHYAVNWDAKLHDYIEPNAPNRFDPAPATCDNSIPDDRPINHGDTGDRAIVLREADGTAWVIWDGQREHIPTGQEFECWVNPGPGIIEWDVWDQVTQAQLNHWPIMTNEFVSNCGGF